MEIIIDSATNSGKITMVTNTNVDGTNLIYMDGTGDLLVKAMDNFIKFDQDPTPKLGDEERYLFLRW